ncbi:hypothetical protein [Thiohalocapsa marina]|nr:hypothetical protein [Thiohalocapsa marina]
MPVAGRSDALEQGSGACRTAAERLLLLLLGLFTLRVGVELRY